MLSQNASHNAQVLVSGRLVECEPGKKVQNVLILVYMIFNVATSDQIDTNAS